MATPPARSMPYRGRLCPFNYARMYSRSTISRAERVQAEPFSPGGTERLDTSRKTEPSHRRRVDHEESDQADRHQAGMPGDPLARAEALERLSDAQFRHRPSGAHETRWSRERQDQPDLQPCGRQLAESCLGGHLAKRANGQAATATAEGGATSSACGFSSALN